MKKNWSKNLTLHSLDFNCWFLRKLVGFLNILENSELASILFYFNFFWELGSFDFYLLKFKIKINNPVIGCYNLEQKQRSTKHGWNQCWPVLSFKKNTCVGNFFDFYLFTITLDIWIFFGFIGYQFGSLNKTPQVTNFSKYYFGNTHLWCIRGDF